MRLHVVVPMLVAVIFPGCRQGSNPDAATNGQAASGDSVNSADQAVVEADTAFPDTTGWQHHVSERWGFSFAYPSDALVRIEGPATTSCSQTSDQAENVVVEGEKADSIRSIRLHFSAAALDSILSQQGFRRVEGGWVSAYGDDASPENLFSSGNLSVLSGSQLQRTFSEAGGATETATATVAILRRRDSCAIVLRYDEIEARGAELMASATFRTLRIH